MATLQQALTRIDTICPNAWDDAAKLLWLNECESMIQTRILGTAPEACITYDADTARSTVLLVPAPFDRLYVYYVIAMCDYAAHETAHYADSMMLFNAALDEYAKWYQHERYRDRDPRRGGADRRQQRRPAHARKQGHARRHHGCAGRRVGREGLPRRARPGREHGAAGGKGLRRVPRGQG